MRLIFIRHTRTAAPAGRIYGSSDVDLADSYETERTILFEVLRRENPPNRILCSPLLRARRLAEDAAQACCESALTVESDARLAELHFGAWEGRDWAEIEREHLDAWAADPVEYRCPEGESYRDLLTRVGNLIDEVRAGSGACVWLFCHAGPIRAALAHALGLPPGALFDFEIELGRTSALAWQNARARLLYLNR